MAEARALAEPRHMCHACGGCCHGVRVRPIDTEEHARVAALAAQLGVAEPWVDGALRTVDGRCALLDDDRRCRLHGAFGAAAKPHVCRQYPLVAVDLDVEERVGVDPGCYTFFESREAGARLAMDDLAVTPGSSDEGQRSRERALLDQVCPADASPRDVLARLMGDPDAAWARWQAQVRARRATIEPLLAREDTGGPARAGARALLDATDAHLARLPSLTPALARHAVASARALVFLRLVRTLPPEAVLVTSLLGFVAAGACEEPAAAVAAWTRVLRAPAFARALVG